MALKAAALGIVLSLGAAQAMAQPRYYYGGGPPPGYPGYDGPMRGLSMQQIARVVRSAGLRPVARPRLVGRNYIVSSVDRDGVVKRVVIDAEMGAIVRIRAAVGPIDGGGPGRFGRPPGEDVSVMGPDAGPPGARWSYGAPPRPHARIPGVNPVKPAQRKENKENAVASVPPAAAPAAPDQARPPEADTESLPKAEGAVTLPASPPSEPVEKTDTTASVPNEPAAAASAETPRAALPAKPPLPTRNATVMPAKPPLPVRRPAPAAEPAPAVAAPTDAAKEATPTSAPRVVMPGGPAAKNETTASSGRSGQQGAPPKAVEPPPPAASSAGIVPAQSYE